MVLENFCGILGKRNVPEAVRLISDASQKEMIVFEDFRVFFGEVNDASIIAKLA